MEIKIAKVTSIRVQHARRAHHMGVLRGRKGADVKMGERGKSCGIIPHILVVRGVGRVIRCVGVFGHGEVSAESIVASCAVCSF